MGRVSAPAGLRTAFEAVYSWNYEGEIDQLRTLYANALERQWIALRDLAPPLKKLLDRVLETDDWMLKAVGMQVVTEGLALYSFLDMRNQTREPLLRQLLPFVARDEARHTGFGIKYLGAVVPTLTAEKIAEIEDFAFECARLLIDSRTRSSMRDSVMQVWSEVGVDPAAALRSIGLYSERIAAHFQEMFIANLGVELARATQSIPPMPQDLEAWVSEEPGAAPAVPLR